MGVVIRTGRKPQVSVALSPELVSAYGALLPTYLKEGVSKVIEVDWRELNRLPKDVVEEFYATAKLHRRSVRVSPEVYEKWEVIPRLLKKRAQYWINQWLLERAKELELL
jgi:hypothetical protein